MSNNLNSTNMNKTIKKGIVFAFLMAAGVNTASAQFSLKNLAKSATSSATSSASSSDASSTTTTENKINKSDFHKYEARKVYITDDNGVRIKTAAGTDSAAVRLFDVSTDMATMVSPTAIKAQSTAINKAVLAIAAKAAVGAGIGALSGGGSGALAGLATGLGLSVADIKTIVSLKKDINKQKKVLEAYEKSYNEEGQQIVAELDKDSKKALGDLDKTATEMKASDLKAAMEKDSYKSAPTNSSIEALTAAAANLSL